jgi:NADH-quinone oxidoreductase subunit E
MKKVEVRIVSAGAERPPKTDSPKGRGSAQAPARPDPEVRRWLTAAEARFDASRSSMIPMLQSAQAALGYLPREAMQAIGRHLTVPTATVEGVASFYAQFRFEKPGRHRVTVCSGTACYVRGSGKLMADMQADLKIVPGGTTPDGEITLESVSCFGACALAPVVVLDDKVLRQQTTASLKKAIHEVSAGPAKKKQAAKGAAARGAAAKGQVATGRTRAAHAAPAARGASK